MRHDRIGPEHDPRPVLPGSARTAPAAGLWAAVMSRLRPARAPQPATGIGTAFPSAAAPAPAGGETLFHPRQTLLPRPSLADPRPVIFGAADPGAEGPAVQFLQAAGRDVLTCPTLRSALARAHGQPMAWSALVLLIDGFGGPRLVAEGLLALRRRLPRLPVILVSEEVTFHDFSTERLPMCDVTLRGPLTVPALELALAEAPVNNLVWQARVAAAV